MKNSTNEIWKDIPDLPFYQASNLGNIRSVEHNIKSNFYNCKEVHRKGRILRKQQEHYYRVMIMDNGKRKKEYVHRLVARAFVENPNHYDVVNHIDGNKYNNRADNLEWCTQSDNVKHSQDNELQIIKRDKKGKFVKVEK